VPGFDFLVSRLRKVLDEEDTFWTLVMIVETYMAPNFYVGMHGARTQACILQKIIRSYCIPELWQKLDDPNLHFDYIENAAIPWFTSLFAEYLPEDASLRVLDLFFLHG